MRAPGFFRSVALKAATTIATGLGLTDPRLIQWFSGGPTFSGEEVTVRTALQLDAAFACIRLKAGTAGTLPCETHVTLGGSSVAIVDPTHPLYTLLHDQPNADMSAVEFWTAMFAALDCWGNAWAQKLFIGRRLVALEPLHPGFVERYPTKTGEIRYRYNYNGVSLDLGRDEIFHIKGFTLDGRMGISPIAQGRQSIGISLAAERTTGSLFKNGLRPSMVLTTEKTLTEKQRQEAQDYLTEFAGAINAGKVPLLHGGLKADSLAIPPDDAQLLLQRHFGIETICRWFGVPPAMIGHTQSSTAWGTGMEQMLLWFLQFTLRAMLKSAEQAIRRQLILPEERNKVFVKFNIEGLLRADSKARAEFYAALVDHGIATRNEIRALENLAPLPGGDDLTVNGAMVLLKMLGLIPRKVAVPSAANDPASTTAA